MQVVDHAYGKHTIGMGFSDDQIAIGDTVEVQGSGQAAPAAVSGSGSIER